MKLIWTSLFDKNLYKQNELIAKGAYGNVYEWSTNWHGTELVAIKQMNFPSTIDKRWVLYDIFTEVHISTVDWFKSKKQVVDVYDYGVDDTGYHLVMKRYKYSLKQWRNEQTKTLKENLAIYLGLYKDVLKAVELLHNNNVTHYDIKADNVFLDVVDNEGAIQSNSETNFLVALGDFGECKMFISDVDEFWEKNRGTELFMSPEMFMLAINTRKDTEKYDRRKRMGTNRLSDIWSLGWLFYELLTGQLLFKSSDELFKICIDSDELISKEKYDLLDNNVYLIDFLNFMLIKDPRLRPSISSVIKRFEHVHALLVVTAPSSIGIKSSKPNMTEAMMLDTLHKSVNSLQLGHEQRLKTFDKTRISSNKIDESKDTIMTINQDIFYWSKQIISNKSCYSLLLSKKITHIITLTSKGKYQIC
jgi:serine/threonine protein kinase